MAALIAVIATLVTIIFIGAVILSYIEYKKAIKEEKEIEKNVRKR